MIRRLFTILVLIASLYMVVSVGAYGEVDTVGFDEDEYEGDEIDNILHPERMLWHRGRPHKQRGRKSKRSVYKPSKKTCRNGKRCRNNGDCRK